MMTDDDLHTEALERFEECESFWGEIYDTMHNEIEFLLGDQWREETTRAQDQLRITVNKCPAFVNNVVNEMRASRPAIKTMPVDDDSDPDTAETLNGIIRNIEAVSDAPSAYDAAAFYQVASGLGFARIDLDWIEGAFDQDATIKAVDEFSSVYIDPMSKAIDGSDMRYAFIVNNTTSKEDFEKKYPDAAAIDFEAKEKGWVRDDKYVRIAEYFYIETDIEKIHELDSGEIFTDEELKEYNAHRDAVIELQGPFQVIPPEPIVKRSRDQEVKRVKWCKLNGQEILEKTEWVSKYIPVIPFYGNRVPGRDKVNIFGLIRDLIDPQMMYNYWKSAHTESICLQPKSPWLATQEQIEGYERDYKDANNRNRPVLLYNHIQGEGGVPVPPPMRQPPPQPSMAMFQEAMAASDDMKAVSNIYDASLGNEGNYQESGRAIIAKQKHGESGSFHYLDNQAKSIRQIGKILVDLIPKIYSGPRVLRILGEDGSESRVPVNQPYVNNGENKEPAKDGISDGIYKLDAGKYDVSVSVGPSFASRRQEALDSMMALLGADPTLIQKAGDIFFGYMDWPGAQELAERIKKTIDPALLNDEQTPEQHMLAQAEQAIEVLKQELDRQGQLLQDKSRREDQQHQIDLMKAANDERLTEIKAFEAQIKAAQVDGSAVEGMAATILQINERLEDTAGALEILLDADEGQSPQPIQ